MMGHQARPEGLFYYFRLEDQVAENHLPRPIARHISFAVRDDRPFWKTRLLAVGIAF
jgi:hypothetical protein